MVSPWSLTEVFENSETQVAHIAVQAITHHDAGKVLSRDVLPRHLLDGNKISIFQVHPLVYSAIGSFPDFIP